MNNFIVEEQSGFRKKHSCETAINFILNDWKLKLEGGYAICAVFLDLKRAFETVNRSILLSKLEKYGIGGKVLNWLNNYLSTREQAVKFNGVNSKFMSNNIGVPQGSVLGVFLFLIYINDIKDVLNMCKIKLFADDTLIYFSSKDVDSIFSVVSEELTLIEKWLHTNKLKLNVKKTKALFICSKAISKDEIMSKYAINLDDERIEFVKQIKYLGVIIDNELTGKAHIDYISRKIASKINYLRRIRNHISMWCALQIYNCIIKSHFQYCATVFYLCKKNEIDNLQKLQNRAMRVILKCGRRTHIEVMLNTLNWLNVDKFIQFNGMVFLFKLDHELLPDYLCKNFDKINSKHNYNTRQGNDYYVVNVRKSASKNIVLNKGLIEYNKLPDRIKNAASLRSFKRMLLDHLSRND